MNSFTLKILLLFALSPALLASTASDIVKTKITGKVAKYIESESQNTNFQITTFNLSFAKTFDKVFSKKSIQNRPVKINHINDISQIKSPDILVIGDVTHDTLKQIIAQAADKKILTVSDASGFVERGGVLQYYLVNQRIKIRINLSALKRNQLSANASFLKIADVYKEP